jgi:hypothetical protein
MIREIPLISNELFQKHHETIFHRLWCGYNCTSNDWINGNKRPKYYGKKLSQLSSLRLMRMCTLYGAIMIQLITTQKLCLEHR